MRRTRCGLMGFLKAPAQLSSALRCAVWSQPWRALHTPLYASASASTHPQRDRYLYDCPRKVCHQANGVYFLRTEPLRPAHKSFPEHHVYANLADVLVSPRTRPMANPERSSARLEAEMKSTATPTRLDDLPDGIIEVMTEPALAPCPQPSQHCP